MIRKILRQIFSKALPKWFKILNLCILLPVLVWPWIFFTTIFFFDNPKSLGVTYLLFFAVNAYPFYLLIIAYFNSLLFQKSRLLGSFLPSAVLLTMGGGAMYIAITIEQKMSALSEREERRKEQGFIGVTDDFKIVNGKVFWYDTLIVGADARTFEIVNGQWQRDKNYYYRFGKKVTTIDRSSFELLDYSYAKDKFHVYYDEDIIDGADAKTFHHIEGTQDGKDANNCYRWGEKVDCKVLETEE